MERPCPNPWCVEGLVNAQPRPLGARSGVRRCPVCRGTGRVDETAQDLHAAGVIVPDASEEDFRSSPFHTSR